MSARVEVSAQPPPAKRGVRGWIRAGLLVADQAVHSKTAVWVVIIALFVSVIIATAGFEYWGWPAKFIPLYQADAAVLVIAAALYAIVVRWDSGPSRTHSR